MWQDKEALDQVFRWHRDEHFTFERLLSELYLLSWEGRKRHAIDRGIAHFDLSVVPK